MKIIKVLKAKFLISVASVCLLGCERKELSHRAEHVKETRGQETHEQGRKKSLRIESIKTARTSDIFDECDQLLGNGESLTVEDRKRQMLLLNEAVLRSPENAFDLLKKYIDLNDFEVVGAILRNLMEQKGQAVAVVQFGNLRNLMTDKKDNRLALAFIDALSKLPSLEPDTVGFLREFSLRQESDGLLASLLNAIAIYQSTPAALTLIKEIGLKGVAREKTLLKIGSSLSGKDPQQSILLLNQVNPAVAGTAYQNLFENWFSKDPEGASMEFRKLPWNRKSLCFQNPLVVNQIIEGGGEKMLWSSLDEMPVTGNGFRDATNLLKVLSTRDPELAVARIESCSESPMASGMAREVFEEIGGRDTGSALEILAKLGPVLRDEAMSGLLAAATRKNMDQSIGLIEAGGFDFSDANRSVVVSLVAERDPAKAWNLMQNEQFTMDDGEKSRPNLIRGISEHMAKNDPERAASWVLTMDGNDARTAVVPLISFWINNDPDAASGWLADLAPGPMRDAGAAELIKQMADVDPERAEQWIRSMGK